MSRTEGVALGTQHLTLLDGSTLNVGSHQFCLPEIMFNPLGSFAKVERVSMAELVNKSVNDYDQDVRADLLANIVLAGGNHGGNTMFEGFQERMQAEIELLNSKRNACCEVDGHDHNSLGQVGVVHGQFYS